MSFQSPHRHAVLGAFAKNDEDQPDELVIPDDLTALERSELDALLDQSLDAFKAIYGDGSDVSAESLDQLKGLKEGIAQLREEVQRRDAEQEERAAAAREIAAEIEPPTAEADEDCEDCDESNETDEAAPVAEDEAPDAGDAAEEPSVEVPDDASEITEAQPEPVAASTNPPKRRGPTRINMSGVRARQARTPRPRTEQPQGITDVLTAAPDLPGFGNGQGLTWLDVAKGIDTRLAGFNRSTFARAHQQGKHLRQQHSVAVIRKPTDPELTINSEDPTHIDEVIQRATSEQRLPGGSLTASGGWCAPSEILYDLCQLESRDGLLSIPEVTVNRGGLQLATGPDFSSIYTDTGFCYTEEEDEAGDYDGEGGGEKPCFRVPCPTFTDYRLDSCGLCIEAGLLQSRGYPEVIARTTSGAMIAYDHRMNAKRINEIVTGSTAVTGVPTPQEGATAPLLAQIELQVEIMSYRDRLSRSTTLEGIFPYWVRGLVRADLSRRMGVDLIDVSDARINAWFTQRRINPQFVYDWQDLEQDATSYPETLDFLLYPAGAWFEGTKDIISLDTIYDSTLLGTNDYTALFFEQGWFVAPRCGGSRVVTVPVCPSGSTHGGTIIACDGSGGGSVSV